jgi:pyrimidine operon attenuation protein / uracil phosphoribosyltransferase
MHDSPRDDSAPAVVLDAAKMQVILHRLAQDIVDGHGDVSTLALLGVLSRGRPLAERIGAEIEAITGVAPKVGSIATTLYRDDLRSGSAHVKIRRGETHFDFDVNGLDIVLIDDVVSAGRTIRAALDEVMDYGRPRRIQLACLIDRGHRELPIQPDYCGWAVATNPDDHIQVKLQETDGEDIVLLEEGAGSDAEEGE